MEHGNNPFASLNWQMLSPWKKTLQVLKYWANYYFFIGYQTNRTGKTKVQLHAEFIAFQIGEYYTYGKSPIHNKDGNLNEYATICKNSVDNGEVPTVPWNDLIGSWFIWILVIILLLKLIEKKR